MFKVKKDYIEINDLSQFNIDQILESGQIFSYEKMRDYYLVLSGNKCAKVKMKIMWLRFLLAILIIL